MKFGYSSNRRRTGFSIVELLAVLTILALLAGLALPFTLSVSRSSQLRSAGNRLANLATLARQTASSRNTFTAVVIAHNPVDSRVQAMTVAELDRVSNQWRQLVEWMRLPPDLQVSDTLAEADPAGAIASIALTLDGQPVTAFSDIVFSPDGRITHGAEAPRINVRSTRPVEVSNYYDLVFNKENAGFSILRP